VQPQHPSLSQSLDFLRLYQYNNVERHQQEFITYYYMAKKLQISGFSARQLLDKCIETPQAALLGPTIEKEDIQMLIRTNEGLLSPASFHVLPEYKTQYPRVVSEALCNLYAEYNSAFRPLMEANREFDTDYQYCIKQDGSPLNGWVQIDMVGLPDEFLRLTAHLNEAEVREALRGRIFEIENSLAMYQLWECIFSSGNKDSFFKKHFRASLDNLRHTFRRKIALLAVTNLKYQAMKESEFGKTEKEPLSDKEVMRFSGFDRFFGPREFERYLKINNGQCDYLLYARASDPITKLKRPNTKINIPLLENDSIRQTIKANSLTLNIDNPAWGSGNSKRINDTKAWMSALRMSYDVNAYEDVETNITSRDKKGKLKTAKAANKSLIAFLTSQGIDLATIDPREATLRAKPMLASYGCYGHTRGSLKSAKFRIELKKGLRERGPYVLQPEMQTPIIKNKAGGQAYTYIDRNFFTTDGKNYKFMGGFRSLMPVDSVEAKAGRNHGSKYTVWAEIN
jgi:hypothetical protein